MNLTPWRSKGHVFKPSHSSDLSQFQREMNHLFNNFFSSGDVTTPQLLNTGMYPSIDLQEKDTKYVLDADLPGMNEEDIEIEFHNNVLTIKGETKDEKEIKDGGYVCVERSRGMFSRDIFLDEEIDKDNIKAELKNGVLHVELDKKDKTHMSHKKIPIRH